MSCTCGTVRCYASGLCESECDKAGDSTNPSIYDDNKDFESNVNRCPMYLNQLQHEGDAWCLSDEERVEEDEECFEEFCVSKLHRWRTLGLLKVRDDIGADKWAQAERKETFPCARNSTSGSR